jgi:hypothetical protein
MNAAPIPITDTNPDDLRHLRAITERALRRGRPVAVIAPRQLPADLPAEPVAAVEGHAAYLASVPDLCAWLGQRGEHLVPPPQPRPHGGAQVPAHTPEESPQALLDRAGSCWLAALDAADAGAVRGHLVEAGRLIAAARELR